MNNPSTFLSKHRRAEAARMKELARRIPLLEGSSPSPSLALSPPTGLLARHRGSKKRMT